MSAKDLILGEAHYFEETVTVSMMTTLAGVSFDHKTGKTEIVCPFALAHFSLPRFSCCPSLWPSSVQPEKIKHLLDNTESSSTSKTSVAEKIEGMKYLLAVSRPPRKSRQS